jgi:outer membrane protein assembly factor BamB
MSSPAGQSIGVRKPPRRLPLSAVGVFLLLVFSALAAYQKYRTSGIGVVATPALLEELAEAEILEEGLPAGAALDWPQWRGPTRMGVTSQRDLLVDWPARGPRRLWQIDAGEDGYSSFAVSGELVYSMATQADGTEAVLAWSVIDGKERWRYSYQPAKTFDYGGPRATPALAHGRLYTLTSAGTLLCLNANSGTLVWEVDLVRDLGARAPRWGFACSPLVEGDRVFVVAAGTGGRCLAAFDRTDGTLLWARQDDPGGYSSPVAITVEGVRQIVFFTGRRLLGVAPEDGRLLWELLHNNQFDVNAATPLPIRARLQGKELHYLFVSIGYSIGSALVRILPGPGGTFRARAVYHSPDLCCHFSTPVLYQGYVYALDEKRDLTCLDLRTGKAQWRQSGFQKGSLIRVDGHLIVLGESGRLALVEATPEEYREKALARPFQRKCWTLPALAGGRLFLRDQQRVLCLDLRAQKK